MIVMAAVVVGAWASTGSARRGSKIQLAGGPRAKWITAQFVVPTTFSYVLTWIIYLYGRDILG
jgi:hypothetical protein